jgi:RNA polymerase sigma-70 factor (ECF subfamily)
MRNPDSGIRKNPDAKVGRMGNDDGEVTRLLRELNAGSRDAIGPLLEIVYDELRRIARERMSAERKGHTLDPTALVHEAYLRLVSDSAIRFGGRNHFFRIAARAMERVLIDHGRKRRAAKRDRGGERVPLEEAEVSVPAELDGDGEEFEAVAAALEELEGSARVQGRRKAEAVRLRYLVGCSLVQIAEVQGVSVDTVERDLRLALAWLRDRMGSRDGGP